MTALQAAWACPIDQPPIRNATIEIEDGVIQSVQSGSPIPDPGSRQLGNVVVLPGLVNAHTHLELSWLRGRVPPANRFTDWVKTRLVMPFVSCVPRGRWPWATSAIRSLPSSR
jgi:cytosine/adenosine deaminase-related metal-dependent hydrolase